jgi:hypothetical protein
MQVQIVTFNLNGITKEQYEDLCNQLAPAFAAMRGLIAKVWLADDQANSYGGVYLWRDNAAYETYLQSDIFKGIGSHTGLSNVNSMVYGILEAPSAVTRALELAGV